MLEKCWADVEKLGNVSSNTPTGRLSHVVWRAKHSKEVEPFNELPPHQQLHPGETALIFNSEMPSSSSALQVLEPVYSTYLEHYDLTDPHCVPSAGVDEQQEKSPITPVFPFRENPLSHIAEALRLFINMHYIESATILRRQKRHFTSIGCSCIHTDLLFQTEIEA